MTQGLLRREIRMDPGYVLVPSPPAYLFAVVGSGVLVAIYDRKARRGGMCHYLRPRRPTPYESTAHYAGPAVFSLVRFLDGTRRRSSRHLTATIIGGAERADAAGYVRGLGRENVRAAGEILAHFHIPIARRVVGGRLGRKAVFHSASGELAVEEVERIRADDWYPALTGGQR